MSQNNSDAASGCSNSNCKNNSCSGPENGQQKPKNRICRDFVNGFCRRMYCRFPHVLSPDQVIFCHDYQNTNCVRNNCKFLHFSIEEQDYYKTHGEFPPNAAMVAEERMAMGVPPPQPPMLPPPPPPPQLACKDYDMFGRFRSQEYLMDKAPPPPLHRGPNPRERLPAAMWNSPPQMPPADYRETAGYRSRERDYIERDHDDFMPLKRSAAAASVDAVDDLAASAPSVVSFKRERLAYRERDAIDMLAIIRRFEEEQAMLRRRVEANELKIAELRVTNEYLLTQNAHIRLGNVQVSTVMSPVTHTTSQNAIIGGVSIAPVQVQGTPIVSIATPQCSQIIATSSGAPIAIANTSQGQQLAISQQNISTLANTQHLTGAAHPQQILSTSQITLAPAGLAQRLTINNTSQGAALTMSNANQSIISYPVMTHSILPQ